MLWYWLIRCRYTTTEIQSMKILSWLFSQNIIPILLFCDEFNFLLKKKIVDLEFSTSKLLQERNTRLLRKKYMYNNIKYEKKNLSRNKILLLLSKLLVYVMQLSTNTFEVLIKIKMCNIIWTLRTWYFLPRVAPKHSMIIKYLFI